MKVTLIDYGAGNVPSVERALQRLGAETERTCAAQDITAAQAIVLPGVGHFSALVRALDQQKIRQPLADAIQEGVPYLGICLGLQALFESSEEAPDLAGLGLLPGRVCALPCNVKLPHMGWNQVALAGSGSQLLAGSGSSTFFYFAHSYAAPDSNGSTVATCFHGAPFVAVLEKENIFGVQFHPEKSGDAGSRVLENFLRMAMAA